MPNTYTDRRNYDPKPGDIYISLDDRLKAIEQKQALQSRLILGLYIIAVAEHGTEIIDLIDKLLKLGSMAFITFGRFV